VRVPALRPVAMLVVLAGMVLVLVLIAAVLVMR
jgi:hypothetical protein